MPALAPARISKIHAFNGTTQAQIPLYSSHISAGFPSPAEEYVEAHLDLNEKFIENPAATFILTVQGNSMTGAGIHDGDILIVDRSIEPVSGKVVVAAVDGELLVKRLKYKGEQPYLIAEHPDYPAMPITAAQDFQIWGVVTWNFHPQ